MNRNKLKQLEIRISDTAGTSLRTVIDFERSYIFRSGIVNHEKVDLQPSQLNELEMDRLKEKLSHLNVNTLRNGYKTGMKAELYWQVVITGEDELYEEVGVDQLPHEWVNFFRLLP